MSTLFIKAFQQRAARSLGQHFLIDDSALSSIARASSAKPSSLVLEIGPGPGGLTHTLLETGARVIAIEKDRRAVAFLDTTFRTMIGEEASNRLTVVEGDALTLNAHALLKEHDPNHEARWLAAGNLPYNIATAILSKLLEQPKPFARWTFMFQKEVALRLTAGPNSKAFGSLSLAVAVRTKPKLIQTLGPEAFVPRPKVDSAVVTFDVLEQPKVVAERQQLFESVARAAFSKRRKTVRNALRHSRIVSDDAALDRVLANANINPRFRAEQIAMDGFIALTEAVFVERQNTEPQADNSSTDAS